MGLSKKSNFLLDSAPQKSVKALHLAPTSANRAALTAHAAKRPGRLGRALFFVQQSAAAQKAKTHKPKERTMQPERAELYFQQGGCDKVYHL